MEDFADVLFVGLHVWGVDQDVIKVDNYPHVQEVSKDTIDKPLEGSRGIS